MLCGSFFPDQNLSRLFESCLYTVRNSVDNGRQILFGKFEEGLFEFGCRVVIYIMSCFRLEQFKYLPICLRRKNIGL